MTTEREISELSEFMRFLAREDGERLPSLAMLSKHLEVSIAALREQLEVARALGLVEVRPKTGIRKLPYTFTPAVLKSLSYAAVLDSAFFFQAFSDLRNHIEMSYWYQAVSLLEQDDFARLHELVDRAMAKLDGDPIEIPHNEHRELHLLIYRRLNNPFVTGILEAYWAAYESVGLNLYTDIIYLKNVWKYHLHMVDSISRGDAAAGYQALVEHTNLLQQRVRPVTQQGF
jgi:DNA-binding FadR family transcriptional regulator